MPFDGSLPLLPIYRSGVPGCELVHVRAGVGGVYIFGCELVHVHAGVGGVYTFGCELVHVRAGVGVGA